MEPANSARRAGKTYFLSPQIRRLRHSDGPSRAKRSIVRWRSCADSLTVSTVWNGRDTRNGATLLPSGSYLPSQISSGTGILDLYMSKCWKEPYKHDLIVRQGCFIRQNCWLRCSQESRVVLAGGDHHQVIDHNEAVVPACTSD